MGLFKRFKKQDEHNDVLIKKEEYNDENISEIKVKSQEVIQKEQSQTELEYLTKEIQTKTDDLNSISQKLQSVKEEYDDVVGKLMLSKKEFHQQKNEFDAMKNEFERISTQINVAKSNYASVDAQYQNKKSTLDELHNANLELTSIRAQIQKYKEEFEKLK